MEDRSRTYFDAADARRATVTEAAGVTVAAGVSEASMAGGCACRRVRFTAQVNGDDAYLCHCRMCQRASGNISLAMVPVDQSTVQWMGEPNWFESSVIAERPFCCTCGTSLGFRYKEGTSKMDLTAASFDDPSRFVPTAHFGAETMHRRWLNTADLPEQRCDEYDKLQERWAKVGANPPE